MSDLLGCGWAHLEGITVCVVYTSLLLSWVGPGGGVWGYDQGCAAMMRGTGKDAR